MSNYITMVERIEDEVDDANIRDQVKRAIQSAIKFYERRPLYFNQKQFTFATVSDQESYSVSDAADIDSFIEVKQSYITSDGVRYPFVGVDYDVLQDSQSGLVTGRPTNWAYFARQFFVYPIADAAYTATISAHYRLTTLVDDTDTNAWMTDAEELIRQRAKKILAIDVTENAAGAVAAKALEDENLDALIRETRRRKGKPALQADPAILASTGPFDIRSGA